MRSGSHQTGTSTFGAAFTLAPNQGGRYVFPFFRFVFGFTRMSGGYLPVSNSTFLQIDWSYVVKAVALGPRNAMFIKEFAYVYENENPHGAF